MVNPGTKEASQISDSSRCCAAGAEAHLRDDQQQQERPAMAPPVTTETEALGKDGYYVGEVCARTEQQQQQQQQRQQHSSRPTKGSQLHLEQTDAAVPQEVSNGGLPTGRGLASSELFLPMLAELFVALFRARCFPSLVARVLGAVEEEIVVEDNFRPYLPFPLEAVRRHSSGVDSIIFNCGSNGDTSTTCEKKSSSDGDSSAGSEVKNSAREETSPPAFPCADAAAARGGETPPLHSEEIPGSPEALREAAESGSVTVASCEQQVLHGSNMPLFAPPLPALFGGYARMRAAAAGARWSSSNITTPVASTTTGLVQCSSPLYRLTSGGDTRAAGTRGGGAACSGRSSGCCLFRGFSVTGGWGRQGSDVVGTRAAAAGVALDMFAMPFFTKLKLVEAFTRMDKQLNLTRRKVVPPSFNECRMLVNLAQLLASKAQLRLITFDGDETLYPDGGNFEDRLIAEKIAALLERGTTVAVVTAAGYGYETERYEERLGFLFSILKEKGLDAEALGHFYVMGGESNYLMRLSAAAKLERVPEERWTGYRPQPCPAEAEELLDTAEAALRRLSREFRLPACILRKPRGVGLVKRSADPETSDDVPAALTNCGMHRENLDEIVMRVRRVLSEESGQIPWSAFNSGKDVWVDVGNKAEGVAMLQGMLQLAPAECMHVGDQFDATGNDLAARVCSPTVWISNPQETAAVLQELLVAD